jgi:hypothetical protein
MKARFFAMMVLGVAAICLLPRLSAQQPPSVPGAGMIQAQIKAARVIGTVTVTHAQGIAVDLRNNDPLVEGDVVVTANISSVVLVFSNGSTVSIEQNSKVSVDTFTQDPFAADVKLSQAKEEPSVSHTKLKMTYGELVGNVKHLNGASTFEVDTPVGAAGIRGTTFSMVYRPAGNGQAFFTLGTASGTVIFQGTTGVPIPVGPGHEVDIQVTIDPTTGAVSVQVNSTTLSQAAKDAIAEQVKNGIEAIGVTTFTANAQQGGGDQGQGQQQQGSGDQGQGQGPMQTTPGDGGSS